MKHVMAYTYAPDLRALRNERLDSDDPDRTLIARSVLAWVAHFAGEAALAEQAVENTVPTNPDIEEAIALERHVRALADRALGQTIDGEIIVPLLCSEGLFDDFQRMVKVEQHLAFGESITELERDDHVAHMQHRADEAREHWEYIARREREDARICTCGEDFGRHSRNQTRPLGLPRDRSACHWPRDVTELHVMATAHDDLEKVVAAYATFRDLHATPETLAAVRNIVIGMRRGPDGARGVVMADALAAAFTAVSPTE